MELTLPYIPGRPEKPRSKRITMVMDKGLSIREAEDFLSVGSEYVDMIKLGFGTSLLTPCFREKILLYKEKGVTPYFGGTLFEAFAIRNMVSEFIEFVSESGVSLVEVSDGSYEMGRSRKLAWISELAKLFTVISEVGSKQKGVVYKPSEWVGMMCEELEAGSVKVIAEARESGTTGIFNDDGSVNTELVSSIGKLVGDENVIWEAPDKSQQAWFIREFGSDVNLGNIDPFEIVAFETLRCGLRSDTFFQFLPDNMK